MGKTGSFTIDKRIIFLICSLYEQTTLRVRCGRKGHLTKQIKTYKGVKQGCLLAPLLFIFYINNLESHLESTDCHPPKLAGQDIPAFLYANDVVMLSRTLVGLNSALAELAKYCEKEALVINESKTKNCL